MSFFAPATIMIQRQGVGEWVEVEFKYVCAGDVCLDKDTGARLRADLIVPPPLPGGGWQIIWEPE